MSRHLSWSEPSRLSTGSKAFFHKTSGALASTKFPDTEKFNGIAHKNEFLCVQRIALRLAMIRMAEFLHARLKTSCNHVTLLFEIDQRGRVPFAP